MNHLLVSVLVIYFGTSLAQLDPDQMPSEWLPEQYPNPFNNPSACGLRAPGYVCDPNKILSTKERDTLNWLLVGLAQNDTRCPCSQWACEQKKQGYAVGVAIMKKMKIPIRSMKAMDQATVFGHYLETNHWRFGRCDEGIVILYSQEDKALEFTAGKTASHILTNDVATALGHQVAYNFVNGEPHHGFYELVFLLRSLLNGNHVRTLIPSAQALHGAASTITVTLSTLVMVLSSLLLLS